ncbi:MAG: tRNA pseudouridine55 synthase, partial [Saprospiraceae bacterium]
EISVRCSKGTYIRSLAYDLGQSLGTGAYLRSLRRIAIGDFSVEDALDIDAAVKAINEISL